MLSASFTLTLLYDELGMLEYNSLFHEFAGPRFFSSYNYSCYYANYYSYALFYSNNWSCNLGLY